MKKLGRVLPVTILVLAVLLVPAISLTVGWKPFIGPKARPLTDRKFESTQQRVERGRYLANGVAGCMFCHSEHDWTQRMAPIVPGKEGAGAPMPFEGLPGRIIAPNLTSDAATGIGTWSDDQLARAIREGVGHDGHAEFQMMSYPRYRSMSDEDLASIIVYLRSLPAVHNPLPQTRLVFPDRYLIRERPRPLEGVVAAPDSSNPVAWGKYLATIGACEDCHTPQDVHDRDIPGMKFAGGFGLKIPSSQAAAGNLTPDASGIKGYDERVFLQAMHTGYVKARPLSPTMPFGFYSHMNDDDMKAIFAYLESLPPVKHIIDNSLPPTYCRLCLRKHGGGYEN